MHCTSFDDFITGKLHQWGRLYRDHGRRPDLSPTWLQSLIAAHKVELSNAFVLFEESDGELVWFLPVLDERRSVLGVRLRRVMPISNLYCLHFDILSRISIEHTIDKVMFALDKFFEGWDDFRVQKVICDTQTSTAIREAARRRGFSAHTELGKRPPFLSVTGGWSEFLAKKSGNFRYNLKRKEKKLGKIGDLRIEFLERGRNWPDLFHDIDEIEVSSWKKEAGTSMRSFERVFYQSLVSSDSNEYRRLLTLLRLDGKPIAYDLSIISKNIGFCLKTSYVEEYSALSPGVVLRHHLMKYIFDCGLREYDFLGDSEPYKLEWASDVREEITMNISNNTLSARIKNQVRNVKSTIFRN